MEIQIENFSQLAFYYPVDIHVRIDRKSEDPMLLIFAKRTDGVSRWWDYAAQYDPHYSDPDSVRDLEREISKEIVTKLFHKELKDPHFLHPL